MKKINILKFSLLLLMSCFQEKKELSVKEKFSGIYKEYPYTVADLNDAAKKRNIEQFKKCLYENPLLIYDAEALLGKIVHSDLEDEFVFSILYTLYSPELQNALKKLNGRITLEIVKERLLESAIVFSQNENLTPIFIACRQGRANVVKRLVSAGANLDGFDAKCNNLLHYAFILKDLELVEMLVKQCPDLIYKKQGTKIGEPIYYAIRYYVPEILDFILENINDANLLFRVFKYLNLGSLDLPEKDKISKAIMLRIKAIKDSLIKEYKIKNHYKIEELLNRNAYLPEEISDDNIAVLAINDDNLDIINSLFRIEKFVEKSIRIYKCKFTSLLEIAFRQNKTEMFQHILDLHPSKEILIETLVYIFKDKISENKDFYVELIIREAQRKEILKDIINAKGADGSYIISYIDFCENPELTIKFLKFNPIMEPGNLEFLKSIFAKIDDIDFWDSLLKLEPEIVKFIFLQLIFFKQNPNLIFLLELYKNFEAFRVIAKAHGKEILALGLANNDIYGMQILDFFIIEEVIDINKIFEEGDKYPLTALGMAIFCENVTAMKVILVNKPKILTKMMYSYIKFHMGKEEFEKFIKGYCIEDYIEQQKLLPSWNI